MLLVSARLRAVGLVPWLLLVAWTIWTGAQEPIDLRRFRIELLYQGIWIAAFALYCQLVLGCSGSTRKAWVSLSSSLALLVVVGAAQSLLAFGADLALHRWVTLDSALRSGCYLALASLGLTVMATRVALFPQSIANKHLASGFLVMSLALGESLWTSGATACNLGAVVLSVAAAVLTLVLP